MGDIGAMSDADRLQWQMGANGGVDGTMGLGARLQDEMDSSNPLAALIAKEEREMGILDEAEAEADAQEQFEKVGFLKVFMQYCLRPGYIKQPEVANRLLWALVHKYYPSLVRDIPLEIRQAQVSAQFFIRPGKDVTMSEIVGEEDSIRRECFRSFLHTEIFVDVTRRDPMMPTKRLYGLAKAFFAETIGDMSLHEMGECFEGDMSEKGHRARWSWRLKQWITNPMKEKGYVSHLTFNKREESRAKYAEAARRTLNRRKKSA